MFEYKVTALTSDRVYLKFANIILNSEEIIKITSEDGDFLSIGFISGNILLYIKDGLIIDAIKSATVMLHHKNINSLMSKYFIKQCDAKGNCDLSLWRYEQFLKNYK